jgi:hypothetical protein
MKKIVFIAAALVFTSCEMKKTESGELPEVDVDVETEAGNLPEYDVEWADVDLKTTTRTVEVPKVVVVMEEEEVEVPVLDLDMPDEGDFGEKSERTLLVEAEVSGKEHDLEIKEIRATGRKLYVIAELEELDQDLQGKTVRVQDQVDINAPDLDVQYIIIGERPDRVYNRNNRYVNSMNDINNMIGDADVIYKR